MDSVTQTGLYCSTEKSKAEQQHRSSKRLVTLLSTCGGNEERSPALNTGHCHDKVLRSHTRRANNNTTDNNNAQHTTSGKRLTRNLQNLSCLAQSETEEHDQEYQGNEELCELLSSGERRKRGGGTEWSALRGLIPSSSSCSSTTNETNELTKQAGLGGTPTSKTSTTRTRRTSCATTGARRRSRRGEHCLANNSSTAITTSNSNNSSDSSQIMCSADGGGEEVKNLCNLSEARDHEKEMCQEDEQTDPGNCTRSVIHQLNKSLTFKQISPPSRNIAEGSANLSKPIKTSENENKQESVTVKCVESESEQVHFYVDGEKFSKISKTSQPSGTSNSSVKTHEIKYETDSNSSSKKLGETASLSYQLSTEKWKVGKGRQHDMQTETNPFSEAIPDNVSMSLLGNSSKAGKASTPSNRNRKSGAATGKKKQVASANYSQFTKSSLNGDLATLKVTPEKKKAPVQSPMLLMNNLPYMGELTFDTRPRRGRKPKKADICHLISKNYGIQFPVSCVNIDDVAGASNLLQPPQTSIPLSSVLSTKPNSQKRSSSSVNATVTSASSRASSTVTAAAPAFCNKDVSIVPILPTPWSQHPHLGSGKNQEKCLQSGSLSLKSLVKPSLSLAEQLMLCPSVTARSRSQQTISMIPLSSESPLQKYQRKHPIMCKSEELGDYKDVDVRQCEDEVAYQSDDEEGEGREEIPLNLCMRDDSSNKGLMNQPLSLCMVKNETKDERHFDVRWKKDESLRMERAQFGGPLGVSKRNMVADGSQDEDVCVRKVGKSAKLSMTQTSSNSSNNFSNHPNIANKVNVLVSQGRIEGLCSAGSNAPAFSVAPSTFSSKNGKQTSSRKKKGETSLRGDISISTQHSAPPFGGTLFGQSTSGINDGAEVSICKFKFTGGAKPSLQEKKMLSVDSGGNFRFYTDKTTPISSASSGMGKGISLDQSLDSSKDCHFALSSLPKSAKSMSICMPLAGGSSAAQVTTTNVYGGNPSTSAASSSANKATNVLQSPVRVQPSNLRLSLSPTAEELQQLHLSMDSMPRGAPSPYLSGEFSSSNSCSSSDNSSENFGNEGSRDLKSQFSSNSSSHRHGGAGKLKRKRRTRKSMMREKLEKTFKEKGFLIQTQQLESAEGATYCKFRQLRKFTRYLFRSWKDYLPDHVKDISDKTNAAASGSPQDVTIPASYPPNSSGCRSPSETEDGKESDLLQDDEDDDEEENMDQDINLDVNDDDDDGDEEVYKKEQDLISQTTSKEAKRKEDDQLDEKDKEAGDSESIDEDELNEQRVVLIEASRAKSLLPKSSTLSKPKMRLNKKETEEQTNDEDEEELQVDL